MVEIKFGERLKELRLDKHLKQVDIAKIMSVRDATVSRWEKGQDEPDYKTLATLAKFFNVKIEYLLGLED